MYLGGKARLGPKIVKAIVEDSGCEPASTDVVDLCCGGLGVTVAFARQGFRSIVAVDAHEPLINMWLAVQAGWHPPTQVSEQTYATLRAARNPFDPMTAFAGFACSWGGKYFGGYARDPKSGRNYALNGHRTVLKAARWLKNVKFLCTRIEDFSPVRGAIHYVDPPYSNTTGYSKALSRDVWDVVRNWGESTYVSEYKGPNPPIWQAPAPKGIARKGAIEMLFRVD